LVNFLPIDRKERKSMKRTILLGAMLVLALLVSACGPAAVTQSPGQSPTEAPATSSPETEPSAATASPAVAATNTGSATEATASPVVAATSTGSAAGTPSTSTTATSEASVPVTGQAEVKAIANLDYGPILANGDGLPLYIYDKDTQNGTTSACADEECTTSWTPLTTEGTATAGPGAIQSLLGTITREDGTTQVTYNGWPLYLYSGDTSSDTTNGQGAEPGWTLISSSGRAVPAQ
jgi:predicted lipoprotein with Yx(FWY)xxD motif